MSAAERPLVCGTRIPPWEDWRSPVRIRAAIRCSPCKAGVPIFLTEPGDWARSGQKIFAAVAAAHDTLEQVWGWSQLAGAALALLALGVAYASWRHAKRSADAADASARAAERMAAAAEETALLAREELDMLKAEETRAPDLNLLQPFKDVPHPRLPNACVVEVGVENAGDADAENVVYNLHVPPNATVWHCANFAAEREEGLAYVESPVPGYGRLFAYNRPHALDSDREALAYFAIQFDTAGPHRVMLYVTARHLVPVTTEFTVSTS